VREADVKNDAVVDGDADEDADELKLSVRLERRPGFGDCGGSVTGFGWCGGRGADRLNQKTRVSASYSNMPYATSKICAIMS